MDDLVVSMNRMSLWNHPYLSFERGRVYAKREIPSDFYLGDIVGPRFYIGDALHSSRHYFYIDHDLLIDASDCLLGWVRKEDYHSPNVNCMLYISTNERSGESTIGLLTLQKIIEGEEVVYYDDL